MYLFGVVGGFIHLSVVVMPQSFLLKKQNKTKQEDSLCVVYYKLHVRRSWQKSVSSPLYTTCVKIQTTHIHAVFVLARAYSMWKET